MQIADIADIAVIGSLTTESTREDPAGSKDHSALRYSVSLIRGF
jgi:hypothetical protein